MSDVAGPGLKKFGMDGKGIDNAKDFVFTTRSKIKVGGYDNGKTRMGFDLVRKY